MPNNDAYHYGTFMLAVIQTVDPYRKDEEIMQRLTAVVPAFIKGHLDSYEKTHRHAGSPADLRHQGQAIKNDCTIYNFNDFKNVK